ncbi:hypothetical protein BDN72DRAFT_768698 [Pluteus cervinus]|uniref:Uncharacterized protein n=1 Tax=Pluteus cervinus TaxID=181527 RepID=A0ACD3AU72_9AGAR|nr:hypothetical protein BDN72DRAFT_768698 [Pluteus cervinus]
MKGCRIEYPPPYSPDFAAIEQGFSVIKSHLRRIGLNKHSEKESYFELYQAAGLITPEMTVQFFVHSGYLV